MSVMAESRQQPVERGSDVIWAWPDEDRPLVADDLLRQPDDNLRYELVDGILQVTPAPNNHHQRAATRLTTILDVACPDEFEVLSGPGVNLAHDLHRIPDIVVIRSGPARLGFLTERPVLAVEVASQSTRKLDRTTKKREYAAFGIDHYWIVIPDRDRPSITAFRRNGKKYEQVALVAGSETFHATEPFAVGIVPALLVADGRAWRSLLH